MEVRIGVIDTPKELTLELEDGGDPAGVVEQALKDGSAMVWFEDSKGHKVGVPTDKLGYIEIEADENAKRVGFGRG